MADRHQFRADWHNYNEGIYFVTICCADKRHLFGEIRNGVMILNQLGKIVEKCIGEIASHHTFEVEIWDSVIMPNHLHMIVYVGTQYIASASEAAQINPVNCGALKPPRHGDPCENKHYNSQLAIVVRTFKAAVTREARTQCIASLPVWQSRFHDHIIRNQRAYENIMNYIDTNVENWHKDCFNTVVGTQYIASASTNEFIANTKDDHEA